MILLLLALVSWLMSNRSVAAWTPCTPSFKISCASGAILKAKKIWTRKDTTRINQSLTEILARGQQFKPRMASYNGAGTKVGGRGS